MKQESNKFFEKRKFIILCAVFVCACILVFKKIFVIIRRTFSYENFGFFYFKKEIKCVTRVVIN